jgi:hypothetical protein
MLKVNQRLSQEQRKSDETAIKRLLLDESGKHLNPDAKVLMRTLMRSAAFMRLSTDLPPEQYLQFIGRRDMVTILLELLFSDLQYYDNLIMMSVDDDNNNYGD